MTNGTGQYRTILADGTSRIAFVRDRSISFQIHERLYRDRKYLPAFDELPWKGVEVAERETVQPEG